MHETNKTCLIFVSWKSAAGKQIREESMQVCVSITMVTKPEETSNMVLIMMPYLCLINHWSLSCLERFTGKYSFASYSH